MELELLLMLFLAHLMGDFLLQPNSWVESKRTKKARSPWLYVHVLIHGLLVLGLWGRMEIWPLALAILITHFFIDTIKLYVQNEKNESMWFFIDQALHLSVLLIGWIWWDNVSFEKLEEWAERIHFLPLITGLYLLTQPTSVAMRMFMAPWIKNISGSADGEEQSLKNAGTYIGILERILIFIFIVSNQWEGVGFLLGAKSVFRFGDLRGSQERKLTEYILIGTLMSFTTAIAVGLIVKAVLTAQ